MSRFTNSKRFKYGTTATILTMAFIAFIVIFNIIFSALASKYMWYADMTEEKVYSLSDAAKEIMSDVTQEVYIHFASEPDELRNGTNAAMTRYIYNTALLLEDEFENVHVDAVSVVKNPSYFRQWYTTTATDIDTTSVILESGGEVRNYAAQAFYTYNDVNDLSTVWAYSGEKKLLSGIMQVTQTDEPIVTFTTRHGESLNTEAAIALAQVFEENGFTVTTADLTRDELDEDCRILVIYDPLYDFAGAEAEDPAFNEIEKVDRFLDNYGALLVFADPDAVGSLTNLNEFLEEWGIAFRADSVVRDMDHAMSVDGYSILAEYQKSDTMGGSIYSDLDSLGTPPKTVIRRSGPIDILWAEGGGLTGTRTVAPVLTSYDGAELVKNGAVEETGRYNLMTVTRESRIVDNEYYYAYVFAVGSPSLANMRYIQSNAYANEDILSAVMKAAGRERVLATIERKPFDDDEIEVTTAEANRWTVAMTVTFPVICALAGLVVITRRRRA